MDFKSLKVKEALENPKIVEIIEKYAPNLTKNPAVKLFARKTCQEIFDMVVSKKLLSKENAEKIKAEVENIIK